MKIFLHFLILVIMALTTLERCGNPLEIKEDADETLAKSVCGSCHNFPDPSAFPKSHWRNQILPSMANFMGIYATQTSRDSLLENGEGGLGVEKANIFPKEPTISMEDWEKIKNYYDRNAPEQLVVKSFNLVQNNNLFKPEIPIRIKGYPSTTLLKTDEKGTLIYGDAGSGTFIEFGKDFKTRKMGQLEDAPVHIVRKPQHDIVTVMGSFSPTDAPLGMLVNLPRNSNDPPSVIIDKLQRPVHTSVSDLDSDGHDDYVVCEFGKYTGALAVYQYNKQAGFVKHILASTPGAIKTELADMNNDGLLDIVALFGQANERIEVYLNQGKCNFKSSELIDFPPYFGSSGFQLLDIDNDGDDDILYTAGDNADFVPIVKPYHGIYFYENAGDLKFVMKLFLHLPGAYSAHWKDFDLDGVNDLVGISFFPDWSLQNPVDCLFWKGEKKGFLDPVQISLSGLGRWIVSDANDVDNDGDMDLVLGSLMLETKPDGGYMQKWIEGKVPFIILKNQTR